MKYIKLLVLPLIIFISYSFTEFSKPKSAEINWMTWEQVQEAQKKEPKKVFVDVYTSWCGWCKRMDATTFRNKEVVEYINENYYAIKFNAETRKTVVFKGQDYKYINSGRRGHNELAASLLEGKMSYPSTVYLDENLDILTTVGGYLDTKTIDPILSFFASDSHLKLKWAQYQENYKSIL